MYRKSISCACCGYLKSMVGKFPVPESADMGAETHCAFAGSARGVKTDSKGRLLKGGMG